jgi:DNA-binding CsgD family transcriptional regulator
VARLRNRAVRLALDEDPGNCDDNVASLDAAMRALSQRECQIAVLVSRGKGTKQIAGDLHISEHTVRSYMRRIFLKLRVANRPAMVAQLLKSLSPAMDAAWLHAEREDLGARRPSG